MSLNWRRTNTRPARLWFYNHVKRHCDNWRFRLRFKSEWIAEGRDPKMMPRFGKITAADMKWAEDEFERILKKKN